MEQTKLTRNFFLTYVTNGFETETAKERDLHFIFSFSDYVTYSKPSSKPFQLICSYRIIHR